MGSLSFFFAFSFSPFAFFPPHVSAKISAVCARLVLCFEREGGETERQRQTKSELLNSVFSFGGVRFHDEGGSKIRQAFFWIGAGMVWGFCVLGS